MLGSLASILKTFGRLPEHMLIVYMRQVPRGTPPRHTVLMLSPPPPPLGRLQQRCTPVHASYHRERVHEPRRQLSCPPVLASGAGGARVASRTGHLPPRHQGRQPPDHAGRAGACSPASPPVSSETISLRPRRKPRPRRRLPTRALAAAAAAALLPAPADAARCLALAAATVFASRRLTRILLMDPLSGEAR